jgi:pyrrolidone-carboxylate peptidase
MHKVKPIILIYGFRKFEHYSSNISESVIAALPKSAGVVTTIFDVEFDSEMFKKKFDTTHPEFIIGLGQHSRAHKIRIERRAQNLMRPGRKPPGRPIERNQRQTVISNLSLPVCAGTTLTYDAGTYVCNYSMWQTYRWCQQHSAYWAFLHIPQRGNILEVVEYIKKICEMIKRAREQFSEVGRPSVTRLSAPC